MSTKVDTYWSWETQPAVVVDYGEFFRGLLLEDGDDKWESVTERDVVDWFKEGQELTKEKFEEVFGVIGSTLPPIPQA